MRVLFIHNRKEWAVHNVGSYWSSVVDPDIEVDICSAWELGRAGPRSYDRVVWGFSTLFRHRFGGRHRPGDAPDYLRGLAWSPRLTKAFAVVQDPCEVFAERADWKESEPTIDHLAQYRRLAVTSREMEKVLRSKGFTPALIYTNSDVPLRALTSVVDEPMRLFTRANAHRRKNLNAFTALAQMWREQVDVFAAVVGGDIVPRPQYVEQIDHYNCYVCTSWQEGGPLPMMDALRRGCLVLSTDVGQVSRLVQNDYNGFICRTPREFDQRMQQLVADPALRLRLRRNAILSQYDRGDGVVRVQLNRFLR